MDGRQASLRSVARAATIGPDRETLLARIPALAAAIAEGAAKRDLDRELPFEAFALFRASGLGALRIPVTLGGPGGSVADYIELIAALGAADSNVAHALRSHFNFTESLVLDPDGPKVREHLQHVLAGKLFGGAHTEQGGPKPGEISTRLSRDGDRYRLNGRKWYATGTAFSDYATFSAKTEEDEFISVLIPTDRPGITILDDWDGMGQKLTASGGVLLENVEVLPGELSQRKLSTRVGRHASTLRQLHLAASAGGAVRAALREGTEYVRKQARSAQHSPAPTAREDHFVQKVIGEIAARSFAIDALLSESARALDRTVEAFGTDDEARIEAALIESSLATSNTQLSWPNSASRPLSRFSNWAVGRRPRADTISTATGGTSARCSTTTRCCTRRECIGDYHLNGTTTHLEEGKVF
jgi:alkylation response protein AidB-like acyl-CoA dehydrogenase